MKNPNVLQAPNRTLDSEKTLKLSIHLFIAELLMRPTYERA